jgi:hypothetical protein
VEDGGKSSNGTFSADTGSTDGEGLSPLQIGGIVGLAVGAVGIGGGAFFLVQGLGDESDSDKLFKACDPGCTSAQSGEIGTLDDDAAKAKTLSAVAFGAGAAALITGTVLLVLDGPSEEPTVARTIWPWVGHKSVGLSGSF